MAEKSNPTNIVSILEQFEAHVVNLAPILGGYYKNMVKNGIPPTLAEQLVMDWHHIFWTCQFSQGELNTDE